MLQFSFTGLYFITFFLTAMTKGSYFLSFKFNRNDSLKLKTIVTLDKLITL